MYKYKHWRYSEVIKLIVHFYTTWKESSSGKWDEMIW